jgi:hypothetical protein
MRDGYRDALCALLLVAIGTLFFADVVFRGTNFQFRDVYPYHMPIERVVRAAIERGDLPLWNSYSANGQPMAANPAYEVFYPPQWLTWVGPFLRGFALHVLLHVYLALLGMFAMLRALALGRPASMFGALSFGLGGFLLGTMAFLPTFFSWAWAPAIGWALLRLRQAPSRRRVAVAAVVMAMPLLIVEPFSLLQMGLLVVVGGLRPPEQPAGGRRYLAAAVVLAGLLAAVQLLPMVDFVRDTVRVRGLPFGMMIHWSMQPLRPLELFSPWVFRSVGGGYWRGVPYLVSLYAGVFVAILAIAGWVARVRGALASGLILIVSYLLAIGDHTPLWSLLYRIGIRSLRYPEKFAAMGVVTMIVFAAFVADAIDRGDMRLRRIARIVAIVVCVALLCPRAGILALLIAAGWVAVLFLPRKAAYAIALLLLWADFGILSREVAPRMPASFFTRPALVDALDRDVGNYAIFHRGEWTQQTETQRYEVVSPAWFSRNALRPITPALWGLRSALEADSDETGLTVTHELLEAMKRLGNEGHPGWSEPFMAMANVRYVFDYRPFDDAQREANGHPEVWRPVRIRRAPGQGRYWFARTLVPARTQDELLASLRSMPDVRGTAFVPWTPFSPAPARVVSVKETTNGARLDVESSGRALLVITVTRHRGWQATIDGAPAELLPANVAFQALAVPAGRHQIELRYRNPLVAVGAVISLLAILACAWMAIVGLKPLRSG